MAALLSQDRQGAVLAEDLALGSSPYLATRSMTRMLWSVPPLPKSADWLTMSTPMPRIAFEIVDSKAKASVTTVVSVKKSS